ncbi:TVP38/TMEM64 family protein [Micromonospora psammae]|uniref:TVP38/TMEM64 family protein n=1 Tax=Micromonospora sp. CPCC 205556 TaxID=3122398 RepID=UPI002FF33845
MSSARRWAYPVVLAGIPAVLVVVFLVVEALDVPVLTGPTPMPREAGPAAAAAGVGLLLVDVALPVPSSLVMTANGALFGVLAGTLLSLIGGLGATLVAFGIGANSRHLIARATTPTQHARAEALLRRYGLMAVLLTRPVPVLAETVALLAGTYRLGWRRVALAGAGGVLPTALVCATAGAAARTARGATITVVVLLGVVTLAGWLVRRKAAPEASRPAGRSAGSAGEPPSCQDDRDLDGPGGGPGSRSIGGHVSRR